MDRQALLKKANMLPSCPGVYIMKNSLGEVIYVGKSRNLKSRVSQYFVNTPHGVKTDRMVASVCDFDTVFCDTELEALALENSKIKQYLPKYNIKLKDGKTYPYIKITSEEYPKIVFSRSRSEKGEYFGPYSSSNTARSIIKTVSRIFMLPTCNKVFPRDIGKGRPCLNHQIGRCIAPCKGGVEKKEYDELVAGARGVLNGDISKTVSELKAKMEQASENLAFESAARYRDTIRSLENLYDKQKVISDTGDFKDVIGIYKDEYNVAISFFYIRAGIISDTENFVFTSAEMDDDEKISSFIIGIYDKRKSCPKVVLVSKCLSDEDTSLMAEYLTELTSHKVEVIKPQKGIKAKLCSMVEENAGLKAKQYRQEAVKENTLLVQLSQMLCLEIVPERIEAYDISNIGNEYITGGMIVTDGVKLDKKNYKIFNIKSTNGQDDYSSMREMLYRRMENYKEGQKGFNIPPDLVLIDGGVQHVKVAKEVIWQFDDTIPVFGMVKDSFHKTRALTDGENEISIAKEKSVFHFIYKIQEEVHRFAITRMKSRKTKSLTHSVLTKIDGIGDSKAKALLAKFKTVSAVKNASINELVTVSGITPKIAEKIINYFKEK